MQEPNSKENPLTGTFQANRNAATTDEPASSEAGSSVMQFYAVSAEQERHFDIILRSGEEYTIPYSLLPVYVWSAGSMEILAYELQITVKGRNLDQIRNYLKKENLIWLKESPSGKDDKQSPVFISDILVRGKAAGKEELN